VLQGPDSKKNLSASEKSGLKLKNYNHARIILGADSRHTEHHLLGQKTAPLVHKNKRRRAGTPPTVQSRARQSRGGRKYREIELRISGRNFWFFGPRSAGTLASVLRRVTCIYGSVFCVTGAPMYTLSRWNTAHCPIPSTTEPWRPQIPRNRAQNLRP
jgi:hypothetical protein